MKLYDYQSTVCTGFKTNLPIVSDLLFLKDTRSLFFNDSLILQGSRFGMTEWQRGLIVSDPFLLLCSVWRAGISAPSRSLTFSERTSSFSSQMPHLVPNITSQNCWNCRFHLSNLYLSYFKNNWNGLFSLSLFLQEYFPPPFLDQTVGDPQVYGQLSL